LFPNFHKCYTTRELNKGTSFYLKDLVNVDPIKENELNGILDREKNELLIKTNTSDKRDIVIHELDREFLRVFALSSLARYQLLEWAKSLDGKNSELMINVQRYVHSIRLFFPILICSYILDTKLVFPFGSYTMTTFE
jgi:hypothetical protein